jgi:small multidrug resistance pump
MTWFLLAIAIVAEIAGTLMLKVSNGFTRLWPSVGVVFAYLTAFALMSKSLKKIDVGITYAIWSGFGIVGAAIGGMIFFNQDLTKLNIIGMTIIIAGVVIMNLGGAGH